MDDKAQSNFDFLMQQKAELTALFKRLIVSKLAGSEEDDPIAITNTIAK